MLKLNREKPNTRICLETKDHSGTARRGHRFHRGTRDGRNPQGMTSTCDQVEGGKGGGTKSWDTSTDAGTGRGAQRKGVEAGGWWVHTTSRWTPFHASRGGREQVQERGATKMNAADGGELG